MNIKIDDLESEEVIALVEEHLRDMAALSPPESCHPLDADSLRSPDVTLWSCWSSDDLLGFGAIKELSPVHGEIKSMRTSSLHRRMGVAENLLKHIILIAEERNYQRLSLETGSAESFKPARELYLKYGFLECAPFADYKLDPLSTFMTKTLAGNTR